MTRDRDGNVWVGTDSRGLLRIGPQGVTRMNDAQGISRGAVTAVFEDREGNLWIGSGAGLAQVRDGMFAAYSLPEGLPAIGSSPVFVDSENRVWFSPAAGGLWWEKNGRLGHVSAAGLDNDPVYSIAGRNGELWLGRQHGGLTRIRSDGGSFAVRSFTVTDGLAQNSVFSVYPARDGSVWAGTLNSGASLFADGKFTNYTIANGLASNTVVSILETRDGATWFATPGGLSTLSNGHWRTYTTKDGLPSVNVICLWEDSGGVLWIGTAAGLAFRDSRGIQVPSGSSSLPREQVMGIAGDTAGGLWISTFSHILRTKSGSLIGGAPAEGDVREFGLTDGLRVVEGVSRSRSVVGDSLGRVWFSLNGGIASGDPARLMRDSVPAIVHVQTVIADNNAIGVGKSVRIPGASKRITFGFIGLSLSAPERVRFRYRLDGWDSDWSKPSGTPEASYTNLSPGDYRFRVVASNPDGVWSNNEAALALTVDSLYWQTWWFGVLMVLTGVLAVTALYRARLQQMTKQLNLRFDERLAERTRLARELHDTLLQTIQGSKMVADDGLDNPADTARVQEALELISGWLAQAIGEARAVVAALRSSATQKNDLAEAFERAGEDCANRNSMFFSMVVEGVAREMHPVVRDEVYRIGYEAIRNASMHSKGSKLEVHLTYARDLVLKVRDNGIGIDEDFATKGKSGHFGVRGMRERADNIGASLRFSSTASGTEVKLIVPGKLGLPG